MQKESIITYLTIKNWFVKEIATGEIFASRRYRGKKECVICNAWLNNTHMKVTVYRVRLSGTTTSFFKALYRDIHLLVNDRGRWVLYGLKKTKNNT